MKSIKYIESQITKTEKALKKLQVNLELAKKMNDCLASEGIIILPYNYIDCNLNNFDSPCYETKGYRDKYIYIYRNKQIKLDDGKIKKIKIYYSEDGKKLFTRNAYSTSYDYYKRTNNIHIYDLKIDHLSDKQAKKIRKMVISVLERGKFTISAVEDPKIKSMLSFM